MYDYECRMAVKRLRDGFLSLFKIQTEFFSYPSIFGTCASISCAKIYRRINICPSPIWDTRINVAMCDI